MNATQTIQQAIATIRGRLAGVDLLPGHAYPDHNPGGPLQREYATRGGILYLNNAGACGGDSERQPGMFFADLFNDDGVLVDIIPV